MAKVKKSVSKSKSSRRMIFNLEVVIVVLVGTIAMLGLAMFVLYQQREALSDQVYQAQSTYIEQNQQISDLQAKVKDMESQTSGTTGEMQK